MSETQILDKPLKQRDLTIDALRGFAIILVVLGHIIEFSYFPHFDENFIFRLFTSFYMALFFLISGYLAFLTTDYKKPVTNIIKKFINLGVPFLSYYFIVNYIIQGGYKTISFIDDLKIIIKSTDYGLWFLWTLFLCFLILNLTNWIYRLKIFQRNYLDIVFYAILGWLILNSPWTAFGWGFVRWYFLFFIIGFLISKYKAQISKYLKYIKEFCFVAFPLLVPFFWRATPPLFVPFLENTLGLYQSIETIITIYNFMTAMTGIVCA